ncbi:MAG: hypothetical protein C4562_02710, partial [Actinobacteria bacterium]
MPELPEVETIKEDLKKKIVGKTILKASTDNPNTIKEPALEEFIAELKGRKIVDVSRRAKNLLIHLDGNLVIAIHLKMTGHLLVSDGIEVKNGRWDTEDKDSPLSFGVNQFVHLVLKLTNNKIFGLSDMRKFATVRLVTKERSDELLSDLGPEPLDKSFTFDEFLRII